MKQHDKGATASSKPAVANQKIPNSTNTEKPVIHLFSPLILIDFATIGGVNKEKKFRSKHQFSLSSLMQGDALFWIYRFLLIY